MPARKKSRIPDDKVEQYEELVATIPEVQRKGADNPYTSLNGNMFSLLQSPDRRLALRLSEKHREAFLKKYQTTLFEAYGIIKKEYVTVPDSLLKKTNELKKYFAQSYEYARTLKPKPTKKKP